MTEVYLVDGVRTPQGRYGGALANVRPDDLAGLVVADVIRRTGIPADRVDEVVLGAANQAGEDNRNVARMAVLLAGLPDHVPAFTVNRLCASGLSAVVLAAQSIRVGDADLVIAGGVESMTRAPWVMAKPGTPWAKPGAVHDTSLGWRFTNPRFDEADRQATNVGSPDTRKITLSMGETAEEVARLDHVTREQSDEFSFNSQEKAAAAIDAGHFKGEIVPVPLKAGELSVDEVLRRSTTMEGLAGLKPIFRSDGIVTAGSSSPLADGASALLLASEDAVNEFDLTPRVRVVGSASAGVVPNLMGLGPVPSTEKVLSRLGLTIDDIDAVELNEAFAAQSLAVIGRLKLDRAIVNNSGGAIALGHPLGCSGARLVVTLMGRLEREGAHRGLATMCVGVGQGVSLIVEAL